MTDVAPRESRVCAKCGVDDTHAHHVQYTAFNHPVTGEGQDLSISKHVQCCAEDGCPICQTDMEHSAHIDDHTTPSDAFTEYMQNKSDEHLGALFEQHAIETEKYSFPSLEEG